MTNVSATRIGVAASEALAALHEWMVIGVTSKGAFLRSDERILFLTSADYRSPFNITLVRASSLLERLQPGDAATSDPRSLNFTRLEMSIRLDTAETWVPPLPVWEIAPISEQKTKSEILVSRLKKIEPTKGYLFLTPPHASQLDAIAQRTADLAAELPVHFKERNASRFLAVVRQLLGSGSGLTPSGDDFLAGFFLYHVRRALANGSEDGFVQGLAKEVTLLAFEKTTTISANRLQAVEHGWSEELFLLLIDHFFDKNTPLMSGYAEKLIDFGHSSGVDTVMGIYYGILSVIP